MVAAPRRARSDAAVLLGGNLFGSQPRPRRGRRAALRRIAAHASASPPSSTRATCTAAAQTTLRRAGAGARRGDAGDDAGVDVQLRAPLRRRARRRSRARCAPRSRSSPALAERVLPAGRFDWSALRSHARCAQEIARVVPGLRRRIGRRSATDTAARVPDRRPHLPRAALSRPPTAARASTSRRCPTSRPRPGEFRLMTLRSEGQFNTVVYEEEDLYRGNRRRDVVMMAARGRARALGVREGDRVRVDDRGRRDGGRASPSCRSAPATSRCTTPRRTCSCRASSIRGRKTPAFKSIAARLTAVPRTKNGRTALRDRPSVKRVSRAAR